MPAAKPPEFRRRAVELARVKDNPVAQIAADLGIAESCLRRRMKLDDVETGRVSALLSSVIVPTAVRALGRTAPGGVIIWDALPNFYLE